MFDYIYIYIEDAVCLNSNVNSHMLIQPIVSGGALPNDASFVWTNGRLRRRIEHKIQISTAPQLPFVTRQQKTAIEERALTTRLLVIFCTLFTQACLKKV